MAGSRGARIAHAVLRGPLKLHEMVIFCAVAAREPYAIGALYQEESRESRCGDFSLTFARAMKFRPTGAACGCRTKSRPGKRRDIYWALYSQSQVSPAIAWRSANIRSPTTMARSLQRSRWHTHACIAKANVMTPG